jgi:hypothetical protein
MDNVCFVRNVGIYLKVDTTLQPRTQTSTETKDVWEQGAEENTWTKDEVIYMGS